MSKTLQLLILIFFLSSCTSEEKKFHRTVQDEWQITQLVYLDKDLTQEGYFLLGFERPGNLWIVKRDENRENKFVSSRYSLLKNRDTLKLDITKTADKRLIGNYDVYIDTIGETTESYIIRLTFDSENTYMEAVRSKLKYYYPPEMRKNLPEKEANRPG